MQIKFGTDGWRGVIARDFTFDNLSQVAQATMDYLNREGLGNKGLIIGYDRRFMSRDFARRVAEIAAGNFIHVRLTENYAPTPAVSWAVREKGAGAGIMITASHNPPEYNGFKIKEAFGGSALPVTTRIIEEIVAYNQENGRRVISVPYEEALKKGTIELFDPCEGYFHQISRYVNLDLIAKAGIKAVVDPMFGAGCGFIPRLLPGVDEIHNTENPSFGGQPPEPIAQNLTELSALLKSGKYKVGLALDGDADRIGAVDENGDFFSSHCIFTVILRHLIEHKNLTGAVVKTVSTTRMVDLLAEKYGLKLFETPIGFKHICELMLAHDILMGGEESGGLGVKGHIPERDGILLGLLLLEAVAVSGKGLRQLLDETMDDIGHFYYQRIDRRIEDAAKERLIERLRSHPPTTFDGQRVVATNFSDGFKFIFENGDWLLIRPSGTEPVLRLYSEAGTQDQVERFLRHAAMISEC
jgi:phosphomannomutase